MRFPISQETVRKNALKMMTDYAKLRDMPANRKDRGLIVNYISGMELMARQLGIDCVCHLDRFGKADKTRPLCSCRLLPQLGGILGAGDDDGGCRDGQGRFVPTDACRGPVGRDAGGRFVSLKI